MKAVELNEDAGTGVAPSPRLDRVIGGGRELDTTGGDWGADGRDAVWYGDCVGGGIGGLVADDGCNHIKSAFTEDSIEVNVYLGSAENTTPNIIVPALRTIDDRICFHCCRVATTY